MKLSNLHESEKSEEDMEDVDPSQDFGTWIKRLVRRKIMQGNSKLKKLLRNTNFTLDHVIFAIKNGECLRDPNPGSKSLGPTYLEQTISNVLRDLSQDKQIPTGKFNDARTYFGLHKMRIKNLEIPTSFKRRKKPE